MELVDNVESTAERYRVSVIVPVYNEVGTVDELLRRVMAAPIPTKQIIVINDGSTDGTGDKLRSWEGVPDVRVLHHEQNRGKGAAVRTGLAHAEGEVTIIQDADLEYDPNDIPKVVEPILKGEVEAVYGSRYLAPNPGLRWSRFRWAVVLLNAWVRVLYGQRLTDEAACYKAMRTTLVRELALEAERFEICPEITAKLCRRGIKICEVPVSYHPRDVKAGKKIRFRDAWQAFWTLFRWRWRTVPRITSNSGNNNPR